MIVRVPVLTYFQAGLDLQTLAMGNGSWGYHSGSAIKNPPAMQETEETRVRSLGWEDALEEAMAPHSSIVA